MEKVLAHTEAGKLIMDKSKKLRLKRKISHQKTKEITEVELNLKDVETITLSSDSDGEAGSQCKQRKVTHTENENVPTQSKKGFLHTDNASLNRLREMILSLSPRDVDITNLTPFPAFNAQVQGNSEVQENVSNLCKGRLQPLVKLQSGEELSPFPKLCKHYRKSSKMSKYNNIHSNDPSSYNVNDGLLNTLIAETRDKVENIPSTSFVVDCDNDSELKASTSRNLNEYREDNSAIIRDRNANFYSLQSQNMCTEVDDMSRPSVSNSHQSKKLSNTQKMLKEKKKKWDIADKKEQNEKSSLQTGESPPQSRTGMSNNVRNGAKICDTTRQDQLNPRLPPVNSNLSKDKHSEKRVEDLTFPSKKLSTSISDRHSSEHNSRISEGISVKQSTKLPQGTSMNDHAAGTGAKKESVTLQSCPLCQMKFDSRVSQMDLDSHIAACLSTSEDDVVW